jgi:hypothetical protein
MTNDEYAPVESTRPRSSADSEMVWILSDAQPRVDVRPAPLSNTSDEYTLKARVIFEGAHPAAIEAEHLWVVEVWLDDGTPLTPRGDSAAYLGDRVEITAGFAPLPQGRLVARILVRSDAVGEWSIALPAIRGESRSDS